MSVRFTGDKTALRRTVNLPAAHSAFTVCGFAKLLVAATTRSAHIVYTQSPSSSETVQLVSGTGTSLRATDDYGGSTSAEVAAVVAGGSEGDNWFFFALVGTAAGANGLRLYHRVVGGAAPTYVLLNNTPGTAQFDVLQLGDAPFGSTNWLDGLIAHLKVYDRALSESEVAAESGQGAPVSSTGLISYHSFSNSTIGTAVVPDTGTGTFGYFTSAPSTSTDMPVFSVTPTLSGEDTLPEGGGVAPPPANPPTLSGEDTLPAGGPFPVWDAATPSTISVVVGAAISATLSAAGTPAPTYSKISGPAWLSINASTGALSGTAPSTTGSSVAVFRATNVEGFADVSITISVVAALAILTTTLPTAIQGQPYSAAIALSGPEPLTLTVTGLPAGLTLLGRSVVGTPASSAGGTAVFTVTAQGGATATQTIVIAGGAAGDQPVVTTTSLAAGTVGTAYSQTLTATGATPITWSVTGALPPGLSRSGAAISGTPTAPGAWQITATATNAFGSASRVLTISAVAAVQAARRTSPWAKWLKR